MIAKFTPGPWRWMNNTSLVGDYGRRHAILIGQNLRQRDESGRLVEFDPLSPDGRLMEAAPDLYRALLAVITPEHDGGRPVLVEGECSEFDSVLAKVRAALAKAVQPCP